MAYRKADSERWGQIPFVTGIKIAVSHNSHPVADICDELQGVYPKGFVWLGWHPNCKCSAVAVLAKEKEFLNYQRKLIDGEDVSGCEVRGTIKYLPENFNAWIEKNANRMKAAKKQPYFITDNEGLMTGEFLDRAVSKTRNRAISMGDEVQGLAERVASHFGAVCTPINFKTEGSIKRKVLQEREREGIPTFSPDRLKDTVRTTIVADRDKITNIVNMLEKEECFIRRKKQNTPLGYTGNIINITTSAGVTAEIQINTAKMIYAKEKPEVAKSIIGDKLWNKIRRETGLDGGSGHLFYEQWRVLDQNSREAKEILMKSREYYSHFTS